MKSAKRWLSLTMALVLAVSLLVSASAVSLSDAKKANPAVKNIIVMIPDGMSSDGITLARWYKAYDAATGIVDTGVSLALDEMVSGQVRTYWQTGSVVGAITDSAPAGTALATGNKTNDKYIGVTPDSVPVATILEAAKQIGKSTGIVATSNVQHATPAAFTSHYNDRSKYDILGEQQVYNNIDVVMGGGSAYLASPYRKDFENILNVVKNRDYSYVTTKEEMNAVSGGKLWGSFASDAMAYDMDIGELAETQPTLAEMTSKSIELLSQNEDGFFLMVEGSKVDWAAHANDPIGLISDILAFDEAVKVALDYAKASQDTMVIAMTDHGNGGVTIGDRSTDASYSKDPVTKFIAPLKKATLTGEGIARKLDQDRSNIQEVMKTCFGIEDLTADELKSIKEAPLSSMNYVVGPMISERASLGWTTGGHTGEEVTLYTYLPGNERITGTINNTDVAKICAGIWGVDLAELSRQLFNDAEAAFEAKGATVEADTSVQSGGRMTVTKDSTTLVILENKNYVLRNGTKFEFNSVVVNQSGKFYVPVDVLNLIG